MVGGGTEFTPETGPLSCDVEVTLDGTTLPDEVYAENDINSLIGALMQELGDDAELQSWWEGPQNTSLYFYGADATRIREVLSTAAEKSPLAVGSTVEHIAGA